jgi:hypothetical protein
MTASAHTPIKAVLLADLEWRGWVKQIRGCDRERAAVSRDMTVIYGRGSARRLAMPIASEREVAQWSSYWIPG